jgi:hypothetical protein
MNGMCVPMAEFRTKSSTQLRFEAVTYTDYADSRVVLNQ